MKSKIKERYPVSTTLKKEPYKRYAIVRKHKFKVTDLLMMGVTQAEKKIEKEKKNGKSSNKTRR